MYASNPLRDINSITRVEYVVVAIRGNTVIKLYFG
jgi:hypothetical protein